MGAEQSESPSLTEAEVSHLIELGMPPIALPLEVLSEKVLIEKARRANIKAFARSEHGDIRGANAALDNADTLYRELEHRRNRSSAK